MGSISRYCDRHLGISPRPVTAVFDARNFRTLCKCHRQPMEPKRLTSLDALRGVAALSIVVWHWQHFFAISGRWQTGWTARHAALLLAAEAALCAGLGGGRSFLRALGLCVLLALRRGDPHAARSAAGALRFCGFRGSIRCISRCFVWSRCCNSSISARMDSFSSIRTMTARISPPIFSWCRTGGRRAAELRRTDLVGVDRNSALCDFLRGLPCRVATRRPLLVCSPPWAICC